MMADKRVKGCPNIECTEYKKTKYKSEDVYCKKCSSKLVLVCSKCWTPLAEDNPKKKICAKCEAKAEDRKERIIQKGKIVGQNALAVLAVVPAIIKVAPEVLKKIASNK